VTFRCSSREWKPNGAGTRSDFSDALGLTD
jgi:hypothetical protein